MFNLQVLSSAGVPRIAGNNAANTSRPEKTIVEIVEHICATWGRVPDPIADLDRQTQLLQNSNANRYNAIVDYNHHGRSDINANLRSGGPLAERTQAFLQEFDQLNPFYGVAYRALDLEPRLHSAIFKVGSLVFDRCAQSATISLLSVYNELVGEHRQMTQQTTNKVLFVYAPSVPKKNMCTGSISDLVVIPRDVIGIVAHTQQCADVLVVGLNHASGQSPPCSDYRTANLPPVASAAGIMESVDTTNSGDSDADSVPLINRSGDPTLSSVAGSDIDDDKPYSGWFKFDYPIFY